MAFTFGEDLSVARDYVRFHTTDTLSPGYMSDALIASLITSAGSNNAAVIAGLKYIMGLLARPDFRADWLQVSNAEARKGFEVILAEKRAEFSIPAMTSSVVHTYRADSYQTEEPTYPDAAANWGDADLD
jgi:hypothetical protein